MNIMNTRCNTVGTVTTVTVVIRKLYLAAKSAAGKLFDPTDGYQPFEQVVETVGEGGIMLVLVLETFGTDR